MSLEKVCPENAFRFPAYMTPFLQVRVGVLVFVIFGPHFILFSLGFFARVINSTSEVTRAFARLVLIF